MGFVGGLLTVVAFGDRMKIVKSTSSIEYFFLSAHGFREVR